jgi:AAA+ superfamily predicted ATPase
VSDVLDDKVAPYASTREHILDEIAIIRARAVRQTGGAAAAEADPGPNPLEVGRRVQLSLAAGVELRLPLVENTFTLTAAERAIVLTTLAAEIDPLFRSICRGLQGELAGPTLQVGTIVELITGELSEAVDAALLFLPEGPLRANALVAVEDPLAPRDVPLQALKVKIDRTVALWLLGVRETSAPAWITHVAPRPVLELARLPEEKKADLVEYLRDSRALVEVSGPMGVGKKFLAEGLCAELGRALTVVDCRAIAGAASPWERDQLGARLAEVRREALLYGAVPYLDHYAQLLTKHGPASAASPAQDEQSQAVSASPVFTMPSELTTFLGQMGLTFLGCDERYEPLEQAGEVVRVFLPFPTPRQRAEIWGQVFGELGVTPDEDLDFMEIGRKLALDAQRIHAAARAAISGAAMRTRNAPLVLTRGDVIDASRHQLSHDLKSLAVRIDKAYRWEDLVISVDGYHSLVEMISYASNAEKVYEQWGFASKHSVAQGISALFSGPPGTGKTMCASVIARELDMELFRVDLSRVVSKWIGETEKNLARVFDEAQRSHAVVLFDEADSLFAKRTEVKSSVDRYANLEVNFLLQRMETFDGITILTTNFEDTIDTAFKRRLTFRIRFEKPDADARGALWEKMFPPTAELAGDVDFKALGAKYEVSGGNIRNAAIRAAFLAAAEGHAIDQDTLVRATVKEAREMGVLIADPEPTASEAAAADSSTAPKPPDPPPRLVPITHRR